MNRKLKVILFLVVMTVVAGVQVVFALGLDDARRSFEEKYPDMKQFITSVRETAIPGLFEFSGSDGTAVYFYPASGYVVVGKIYDQEGKNIAEEGMRKAAQEKMKPFLAAREQGIAVGSGPVEVIEITNPDCGYCRKLSKHLDRNRDITRRIFMVGEGESLQKARYVAAATDKSKALREVMSGLFDDDPEFAAKKFEDGGVVDAHVKLAEKVGVDATPIVLINGKVVEGADLEEIDALILQAKQAAHPAAAEGTAQVKGPKP
ncbi:DsbC family protein [Geomonas paludis]|uniref:DsbC family protein n=1 Tax=Geomonas paludis TaxID=2740185 RepID=A0A6V8MTE3_9BACT|nr:DsbC family protein [Geomonas paludis]UPU38216.1 DsbC family protein [Geomonas paludis]GFO63251.1 hypothetical protein GMPD_11700 [Geomonas paludis]